MLFLERLRENCHNRGSKTAIEFRDGVSVRKISYESLHTSISNAARWLADQGVRPGDRVAVCLPKSIAGFQLHLATCSMGAVSLPLNPAYSVPELQYLIRDSRARLLVVDGSPNRVSATREALSGLGTEVIGVDPERFDERMPERGGSCGSTEIGAERLALMLYTSGTTGRPKGACMTHASLTANMDMLDEAWQWSANDVLLHALPMFHVHGLLVAMHGALHAGASCIVHPSFNAHHVLEDLRSGECSVFMAVPTMYRRILAAIGDERVDLCHMRLLTSGSDRLPVEVFEAIESQLGHRVVERYGMTETGIMLSNPLDGDRVPGQVGIPLPGVEMRIADPETGAESSEGVVGELQTRGPHVFSGYWRDPDKTKNSFTDDRWFRTGDLGRQDSRSRYELKSRMNDLIISGGFNVYPTEVEHVLARHPGVDQCAVVGVPDQEWGEAVTAFVVSRSEDLLESGLILYCRESLAAYKTPKRIVFVESLPRNSMGKVQKHALAQIADGPDELRVHRPHE